MPGPYRSKKPPVSTPLIRPSAKKLTLLEKYQHEQLSSSDLARISQISGKGAEKVLNQQTATGQTLFWLACEKGDVKTVKKLLANDRVDINLSDDADTTPFMAAFRNKRLSICELLLGCGDLHSPMENRADTPKLISVSKTRGNIDEAQLGQAIAAICVEQGLTTVQPYVDTPEAQALSTTFGRNHLAKQGETALSAAFDYSRYQIVDYLLALPGIDPFYDGNRGMQSFFRLCHLGITAKVDDMLAEIKEHPYVSQQKNIINAQHTYMDDDGSDHHYTPLQVAIVQKHQPIALTLIAQPDIDSNLQDYDGSTALLLALETRQPAIAEALLRCQGINVTLERKYYGQIVNLPIMEAAKHGDLSLAAFKKLATLSLRTLRDEGLDLYTQVLKATLKLSEHGTQAKNYQRILNQLASELEKTAVDDADDTLISHSSSTDDNKAISSPNTASQAKYFSSSPSSSSYSSSSSFSSSCSPYSDDEESVEHGDSFNLFTSFSGNDFDSNTSSNSQTSAFSKPSACQDDSFTSTWDNQGKWSPTWFSEPSPISATPSPAAIVKSPPQLDSALSDDAPKPEFNFNLTDDSFGFRW